MNLDEIQRFDRCRELLGDKYVIVPINIYNELIESNKRQEIRIEEGEELVAEGIVIVEWLRERFDKAKELLDWFADETSWEAPNGGDIPAHRFGIMKARMLVDYFEKGLKCETCYGEGEITAENFGDVFGFECPDCNGKL